MAASRNTFSLAPGMLLSSLLLFQANVAHAVEVNFRTIPLTTNPTSLSFQADGVDVTASGFQAEYAASSGMTTTYGPFSTDVAISTPSFLFPGFGPVTQLGNIGEPDFIVQGLGLQTGSEDLGQTEVDEFSGGFEPGFDNALCCNDALPSIQFALFSFSAPVNVSEVIVDDVSNFGRAIWAAGSSSPPAQSPDLLTALAGFTFANSVDDNADGFFTHTFTTLQNIQYLVIGSPPDEDLIGDLGPIAGADNEIAFYIEGLNLTVVPVPPALWLLGSALGLLGMLKRRYA